MSSEAVDGCVEGELERCVECVPPRQLLRPHKARSKCIEENLEGAEERKSKRCSAK